MLPLSSPPRRLCSLNGYAALSSGCTASVCPSISHLVCFSSPVHGTNQYCDTLIQLKAWRKCSCLLVEDSQARQMISQMSVNTDQISPWVFLLFHDFLSLLYLFFLSSCRLFYSTTRWIWRIRRQKRCTWRCWSLQSRSQSGYSIGRMTSASSEMSQETAFTLGTCTQIVLLHLCVTAL